MRVLYLCTKQDNSLFFLAVLPGISQSDFHDLTLSEYIRFLDCFGCKESKRQMSTIQTQPKQQKCYSKSYRHSDTTLDPLQSHRHRCTNSLRACTVLFVCCVLHSLHRHTAFCKQKVAEGIKTCECCSPWDAFFNFRISILPLKSLLYFKSLRSVFTEGELQSLW